MEGVLFMFKLKKDYIEYENKSLRLPRELITKVQELANKNNMSFNKVIIQCVAYALENMEDNSQKEQENVDQK